jgi:hypothetical protein
MSMTARVMPAAKKLYPTTRSSPKTIPQTTHPKARPASGVIDVDPPRRHKPTAPTARMARAPTAMAT